MHKKEVDYSITTCFRFHLSSLSAGALVFLIVWFMFLWLWSIPIIIIEYGVGRFTKKAPIEAFAKLLGPSYRFMGAFQVVAGICIL